ncbi:MULTISPECIES: autotransporter domain-containing protein [Alphaproteobacteria]|uniref:autotransporter outer membrane beta-barrel domain-containing protein n=1 Tax=Alphaproteobacteria TaxID=28211 RepID=UPI003263FF0D
MCSGYVIGAANAEILTVDGESDTLTENKTFDSITVGDKKKESDLTVDSGAVVQSTGNIVIGNKNVVTCDHKGQNCSSSQSSGAVNVTGEGTQLAADGNLTVGQEGTGTLGVTNGGSVQVGGDVVLGAVNTAFCGGRQCLVSIASGEVEVSGEGSSLSADGKVVVGDKGRGTLSVKEDGSVDADQLIIGRDSQFLATDSAVEVTSGGLVDVRDIDVKTGRLSVGEEGTVETTDLTVEQLGSVDVTGGGEVIASGTVSVEEGDLSVGGDDSLVDTDRLSLTQGASADVSSGGRIEAATATVTGSSVTITDKGGLNAGSLSVEQGGTIVLSDGGILQSGKVTLQTSASLTIGGASGAAATGAGALKGKDGEPVVIAFDEGEGSEGSGSIVLNHTEDDFRLDATVTGYGYISQEAGYTSLTGDFSGFTGESSVTGGILSIDTTYGGNVGVADGGTLTGTGSAGDVDFQESSTYLVSVDDDGVLDSTGIVTIDEGASVQIDVDDDFSISLSDPTVLLTGAQITGEFGTLEGESVEAINDNHLFVDLALVYDPTSVALTGERNGTAFADLSRTPNQRATAGGLESLSPDNGVYEAFATLQVSEADEVPAILDQLSGEFHATAQSQVLRSSALVRDVIRARTRGFFDDSLIGSDVQIGTHGPGRALPEVSRGGSIWAQAYGSFAQVEGDGNAARFDASTGGGFAGMEGYDVHGMLLGVFVGFGRTDVTMTDRASSANIESLVLGTYASGGVGPFKVHLGGAISRDQISSTRSVAFSGFADTLEADYAAHSAQIFGEIGYTMETTFANFAPFAGFSATHMRTQSFSEEGGDAALTTETGANFLGSSTLGLRTERTFEDFLGEGRSLSFNGLVAWRHRFGDTTQQVTSAFEGSQPFTVSGAPIDEDTLLVEAGTSLRLNDWAAISANYRREFGGKAQENNVGARLKLTF